MPYLDLIIAIPIAWGMFRGFRRGFIIEICTLMALILGVYGAATFGDSASDYLQKNYNTDAQLSLVMAFTILFIAIVIAVFLFGKALEGVIKIVALGLVNKLFGMLFGGLKFALIVSGLLFVFNGFPGTRSLMPSDWTKDSYLYGPVSAMAIKIYPALGEISWHEKIKSEFENLKDAVID
jgi:membrane protein required for colicin V production